MEIVYNEKEVAEGKELLAKIPDSLTSIAGEIEAGISAIMSTTFKGTVSINTSKLISSAQDIESTILDISSAEQRILDYSKDCVYDEKNDRPGWASLLVEGTLYSNPRTSLSQMNAEYTKAKDEYKLLSEKVTKGEATALEIAKKNELDKIVKNLNKKMSGVIKEVLNTSSSKYLSDSVFKYDSKAQDDLNSLLRKKIDSVNSTKADTPEEFLELNKLRDEYHQIMDTSISADYVARYAFESLLNRKSDKMISSTGVYDIDNLMREVKKLEKLVENGSSVSEELKVFLNNQIDEIYDVQDALWLEYYKVLSVDTNFVL